MLLKRDFVGEDFYAFCQQEFDNARHFLKNCGKPQNEIDVFLIQEAKKTTSIFKGLLK